MKRLLLLRHAKTEPGGADLEDHNRALLPRGREDAPKLGRYIRDNGFVPDFILSSTARRTVETVDLVADALGGNSPVDFLERLYLAEPEAILDVVRDVADTFGTLLVVGHNPGLERLASGLAREPVKRRERDRFDLIEEKFPTAALAVLDFDVDHWRDILPGEGKLKDFVRPRDL
ncbi:MAG: histidine phosphatase family protein [Proteobacteria bacterium]|nr:histidine phosphatase family protein [Pseudomonadota bacterium]